MIGQGGAIERIQFFNGQRLFASDLQDLEAFNREMRWLHNRSLHQPGIGNGFAVYGKKGDREVTVQPGYAIDALGREIVLTGSEVQQVPPVASEDDGQSVFYDLTVAYPDDSDLDVAETRAGVCQPRGAIRLREEPVFCWVRLERDDVGNLHVKSVTLRQQIEGGLRLVLARAEVLNCQLNQDLDISQRRSARPSKLPYVASAQVNNVAWEAWTITAGANVTTIGMKARIDTSEAGFMTTPGYSMRIEGPRVATLGDRTVLVAAVSFLANPTPVSFDVNVSPTPTLLQTAEKVTPMIHTAQPLMLHLMPNVTLAAPEAAKPGEADPADLLKQVIEWARSNWKVVWFGVEQ